MRRHKAKLREVVIREPTESYLYGATLSSTHQEMHRSATINNLLKLLIVLVSFIYIDGRLVLGAYQGAPTNKNTQLVVSMKL